MKYVILILAGDLAGWLLDFNFKTLTAIIVMIISNEIWNDLSKESTKP